VRAADAAGCGCGSDGSSFGLLLLSGEDIASSCRAGGALFFAAQGEGKGINDSR